MAELVATLLKLSPGQKRRLVNFANGDGNVLLRLAKNQLEGNDKLMLTKTLANRVARARMAGKGVQLRLSPTCLAKNQRGGFLQALLPVLGSIFASSATKALNADSAGKRRIQRQLEALRGNGIEYTANNALKRGGKMKEDEFISGVKHAMEAPDDRVSAMIGAGFASDFIDGFVYGFSNPIEATEMLARTVAKSIDGNGLIKSNAKKKNLVVQRPTTQVTGGGIAFF